jgi:hypothetical protein
MASMMEHKALVLASMAALFSVRLEKVELSLMVIMVLLPLRIGLQAIMLLLIRTAIQ